MVAAKANKNIPDSIIKAGFGGSSMPWIKWFDRFLEAKSTPFISGLMIHLIGQLSTQYYEDSARKVPINKKITPNDVQMYFDKEADFFIIPHLNSLADITEEHIIGLIKIEHPDRKGIVDIEWTTRLGVITYAYTRSLGPYENFFGAHIDFMALSPMQVHYLTINRYDVFGMIQAGLAYDLALGDFEKWINTI